MKGTLKEAHELRVKLLELEKTSMTNLVTVVLENYPILTPEDCSTFSAEHLSDSVIELAKLQGVIELLEVLDCGSVGGFGIGQGKFSNSLAGRVKYLKCKYIDNDRTLYGDN